MKFTPTKDTQDRVKDHSKSSFYQFEEKIPISKDNTNFS